ncbi:hypothetical protein PIB30_067285 [Stylosanthes scabra]|uniref:Uncharacterized protein n=1 Tax=Stylosanthes scabra TaxID=79078 RepID=A0ABU6RMH6_9FABA|nr:hypothetical protein [Stylosanthes scabra]
MGDNNTTYLSFRLVSPSVIFFSVLVYLFVLTCRRSLHSPKSRKSRSRRPNTIKQGGTSNISCRKFEDVFYPNRCGLVRCSGSSRSSSLRLTKVSSITRRSSGQTRLPRIVTACTMGTRSFDHPPIEPKLFKETQTQKHDRSVVEKRADDLQPLSRCKRRAMRMLAQWARMLCGITLDFFAESLRSSCYGGSSASTASTQADPTTNTEAVDLREQVQNLIHSLENQGSTGGSGFSTTAPLPPHPPPQHENHLPVDDDNDYEDV